MPDLTMQKEKALDHLRLVELFFFAYRDFTHDPDLILEQYKFGRAHHRVLHFVMRNPGISVSDLLKFLKITKQSLAPILKKLVEQGFVEQKEGVTDRRQRFLYLTEKGNSLARRLCDVQAERFEKALENCSLEQKRFAFDFLFALTDGENREDIKYWISSNIV